MFVPLFGYLFFNFYSKRITSIHCSIISRAILVNNQLLHNLARLVADYPHTLMLLVVYVLVYLVLSVGHR